jgi:integrase
MHAEHTQRSIARPRPWNKGKLVGPKPPFKLKEIWAIRIRLQIAEQIRDLALFNLAIDSKLRGCDLVNLRASDVAHGGGVVARASVVQRKTGQPVRFELTEQTREAVQTWIAAANLRSEPFLFPSRLSESPKDSISTLVSGLRPELVGRVSRVGRALPSSDEHRQRNADLEKPYKGPRWPFRGRFGA